MDKASGQDVVRLEKELLTSPTRANAARLELLFHPEFTEVGRSGRLWSRKQIIAGLLSEDEWPKVATEDWNVQEVSHQVVMVTYQARQGLRVSRHVSIWIRGKAGLQLRYHQATIVPDVALSR